MTKVKTATGEVLGAVYRMGREWWAIPRDASGRWEPHVGPLASRDEAFRACGATPLRRS